MNKLSALGGGVAAWVVNDAIGGGTFKLILLGVAGAAIAAATSREERRARI